MGGSEEFWEVGGVFGSSDEFLGVEGVLGGCRRRFRGGGRRSWGGGRRSFGRAKECWGGRRSFGGGVGGVLGEATGMATGINCQGMTIIIILQVLWGPGDPVNFAVTQPKSFPGEAGFIMQIIPIALVARPD